MIRILMSTVLWSVIVPIAGANPPAATLVEAKPIWDKAPHCAFTDLIYWKNQFVCAFREGALTCFNGRHDSRFKLS